ncbi:adenosine deaminase [Vibrio sinensis]|uniref:Adenosine deaminase n=1 Tax=Vibrio sinensis TaxID=2302434 RepID=A0A3A6QB90_9VIBR|nr:adenosine deaminase [Vibrio sinensis]RJX69424.1 adenosine deaminase [Vibrio sinensis]
MNNTLLKVVLHEHIEGTVTPEMAVLLAEKHQVTLPEGFIYPEGEFDRNEFPNGRYCYDESDFGAFVTAYDIVAALVRDADDYYRVIKDYLTRNAQHGMIYCEIITSAFHLCFDEAKGELDAERYHQLMDAIERAMDEVKQEFGTETRLQACGVRHLSLEHMNLSTTFIQQQPRKRITGFNIAGNEMAGEFKDFTFVHDLVAQLALNKSYHAGEICGPESIREALKFGAKRIGHGIAAAKDDELMELLVREGITLEVAPTSNRILVSELGQDLANHPLRRLYDRGVRVTLNPDDAGLFGTDIGKEYRIAAQQFGFSRVELLDVTLCALEAAFVEESVKQSLIEQVYATFTEQDWQELQKQCDGLAQGGLRDRLVERCQHKPL